MIQVEKLYCYSTKMASITLATVMIIIGIFSLAFEFLHKNEVVAVDYILWKFMDSDWGFYSAVAVIIMQILAASSCIYGVVEGKPDFMIPILVLIPVGLVMIFIFFVNWFNLSSCIMFIIVILLSTYAWVCFYTYWQQLRKSRVGLELDMNITRV